VAWAACNIYFNHFTKAFKDLMRIFQISDLHIGQENEFPQGVDVRTNFLKTVEKIRWFNPDFIVITGDLSFKQGNKNIYRWIKNELEPFDLPVYVVPGNHDDNTLIAEVFHPDKTISSSGKLYFFSKKEDYLFIFLDSWDAQLGTQQSKWFKEVINNNDQERLFIFMHHPPVLADIPHMDGKYIFQEIDAFGELISNSGKKAHIFTGHYHFQKTIQLYNQSIYICPSTFFHLEGDQLTFQKDHDIPGFQIIDIYPEKVAVHTHFVF
jgi:Icc protein